MALKRATKSLPLFGGQTGEVDNYLLEPGGMEKMWNLRYDKKDSAIKQKGFEYVSASGGANHTVDAYGMWSKEDDVVFVENNEVLRSRDNGATWENFEQSTDLLGIERMAGSIPQSGASNFTYQPLGTAGSGTMEWTHTCIAYERIRQDTSTISNHRDVVLEVYDADGRRTGYSVVEDAHSPIAYPASNYTLCHVMMATTTGDIKIYAASQASETWQSSTTHTKAMRDYCQTYNTTNEGYGRVGSELKGEDMRLGYSVDMRYNNTCLRAYRKPGDDYGVCAYKEGSSIKWHRLWSNTLTGSAQTTGTDSGDDYYTLLDCCNDDTYVYLLIAQSDTFSIAGNTNLFVVREPVGGGTVVWTTVTTGLSFVPINGSIRPGASDDLYCAVTYAEGDPTVLMQDTTGQSGVRWYYMVDRTGSMSFSIGDITYSHRLVSNIVLDKNDSPHAVLQQWDNWNPDDGTVGTSPNIPAATPTHKKPVTSVHVRWDRSNLELDVIATYDPGQSKAMDASREEQNQHIQSLVYYDGGVGTAAAHQFLFCNRNILSAEDHFYFLTNNTTNAWATNDGRVPLHQATAKGNVYRLQSSIPVEYLTFDNGMFMGTSVPTWYDGGQFLSEVTTLESPEIVGVTMDGDGASYLAYQDVGISGEDSKFIQAVVGFYDDAGAVHRSAPSASVYYGNAIATTTTGYKVSAYITPPIGLGNRDYFIEVYEALPGATPQLAATSWFTNNDAGSRRTVTWATNLNPTTGSQDMDVGEYRASKTIYTAGNVLAADPWPNFKALVRSGRRLFGLSIADPSTIYYSKVFENGVVPEFSASLVLEVGNEEITALGAIDDKIVAFSKSKIFFLYGTGPDNTGANGDFFLEQLPHAAGCTQPRSVLTYDDGIAFLDSVSNEFKLLTRDLQLTDMGEHIKDITDTSINTAFSVKRALVYGKNHELRWYCNASTPVNQQITGGNTDVQRPPIPNVRETWPSANLCCIYNYKYGKWSLLEESADMHIYGLHQNYIAGLLNWDYYRESDDWKDADLCTWETPWIKVNQLQDFGRFYKATFLGRYLSNWDDSTGPVESGDLQVTIYYDYEDSAGEVKRWRANKELSSDHGNRLQVDVIPERQKCQAIKFKIEEIATEKIEVWEPTYTTGQGIQLVSVDLHYGAKGGSGGKSLGKKRSK